MILRHPESDGVTWYLDVYRYCIPAGNDDQPPCPNWVGEYRATEGNEALAAERRVKFVWSPECERYIR